MSIVFFPPPQDVIIKELRLAYMPHCLTRTMRLLMSRSLSSLSRKSKRKLSISFFIKLSRKTR